MVELHQINQVEAKKCLIEITLILLICLGVYTFYCARITLIQGSPTFLLVRATFTGEKLLRAKSIFAKSKLQIIASLLYKIGALFGQYFGYLSPKVREGQKKKVFAANRCWFWSVLRESVPKRRWRPKKKKVFVANPNWLREYQTKECFGLDLFIC